MTLAEYMAGGGMTRVEALQTAVRIEAGQLTPDPYLPIRIAMQIHKRALHFLHKDVFKVLQLGAWVVGSSAKFLETGEGEPKDVDILVPVERWAEACAIFAGRTIAINRFGGFKVRTQNPKTDHSVDFWPDHLETYAARCMDFADHGLAIRLYPPTRIEFSRPRDP